MNIDELQITFKRKYPHTSSFFSGLILFIVDALVLILCIGIGFFVVNLFIPGDINFRSFINYSLFVPIILCVFIFLGLYPGIMNPATEEIKKFCGGSFFSFFTLSISILISNIMNDNFSKYIIKDSETIPLFISFFIAFFCSIFFLPGFRETTKHLVQKSRLWGVPAVIYTTGDNADIIVNRLQRNKYLGYKPAIIIDSECTEPYTKDEIPVFPNSPEIHKFIKDFNIKVALICDYEGDLFDIMTYYRYTITVPKTQNSFTMTQQLKDIGGIISFASTHNLHFKFNLILKRLLDIGLIILFLPLLIPVFLILMFLTKITSKGPIFYGHRRVGKNGKEFKCWKFRSMCIDSEEQLKKILAENPKMREEWEKDRKFQNDPRVTKFGKILRRTSLDELPQLINILVGQMSFIGPRPVTEPELLKYGEYKDYVLSVTPGLSGMWQTSGRSDTDYEGRIALDTYYIQNWSLWLDIWILIKTVWVVLKGNGAY